MTAAVPSGDSRAPTIPVVFRNSSKVIAGLAVWASIAGPTKAAQPRTLQQKMEDAMRSAGSFMRSVSSAREDQVLSSLYKP